MDDPRTMVDDCLERENKLNAWEQDFISDMDDIVDDRDLTMAQEDKLREIWMKVTGRGRY
jgi:hypothetical protein